MTILDGIITRTNIYISQQKSTLSLANIKEVARWLTRVTDMLGLDGSSSSVESGTKIGWSRRVHAQNDAMNGVEPAEFNTEFHREVSKARDSMRSIAARSPVEVKKELLELSDYLRDHVFVNEGVCLDDRDAGQPALLKCIPKEQLIAARDQRQAELGAQQEKKETARLERQRLEREKLEEGKLSQLEMFRTSEFSAWDEDGIPTKDAQGEEINKSRSKKLRKDWERQKKKHEAWLKSETGEK